MRNRLSQSLFLPGCWGATKQLWNAFHNCFVAPQHPTSLLQPDPCPGAPKFGAASLFPSDYDSGSPPQMSHSIVVAIQRPGATWNFIYANKLPVAHIHPGHAEIIPNCRTNIDTGILITVGTRALVSKDILPMVDMKGADVLPLSVAGAFPASYRYPAAFADRLSVLDKRIIEPGNHLRGF